MPRWVPRSSKPAAGRVAGRGGFDSHPLPPAREFPAGFNRLKKEYMTDSGPPNYSEIVAQVMEITDVTWGDPKRDYLVRFRGRLRVAVDQARRSLTEALKALELSPSLRREGDQDVILLINNPVTSIVSQVFDVREVDWAEPDLPYLVRYVGALRKDSVAAYDQLEDQLKPLRLTPLFRSEDSQQVVILLKGINQPQKSNPIFNLIMFGLTLLSMALVGAMNVYSGNAEDLPQYLSENLRNIGAGLPFAASLLAILLAHELGHYIAGRLHRTAVTLPYFIPFPVPPFGTLGAFIRLKSAPKNRRILHDIGVAGPLAGLIVAIPILIYGLSLSTIEELPNFLLRNQGFTLEGNSILYLLAKYAVFGEWLPHPASYGDLHPLVYWLKFIITGQPFPLGGRDVIIHPVALAGWGGLLVTALNLIPAGQLDGGHLAYVLFGRGARRALPFILLGLFGLGFIWEGWWLWALLISAFGRSHAEPLDQITQLDPTRRLVAAFGLLLFVLVFTPVPLQLLIGPLV